jgi:CheY-like chemotaxis protein
MPTILCIDDSTFGLCYVVKWLNRNGYYVLAAADRATALVSPVKDSSLLCF